MYTAISITTAETGDSSDAFEQPQRFSARLEEHVAAVEAILQGCNSNNYRYALNFNKEKKHT